jgi:hypothetical protein
MGQGHLKARAPKTLKLRKKSTNPVTLRWTCLEKPINSFKNNNTTKIYLLNLKFIKWKKKK